MPFWSEYDDLIKSDIADIKNIGGHKLEQLLQASFFHTLLTIHGFILTLQDQHLPRKNMGIEVKERQEWE